VAHQPDPDTIKINWPGKQINIDSLFSYKAITLTLIGKEEYNPDTGLFTARDLSKRLTTYKNLVASVSNCNLMFNHINVADCLDDSGRLPLAWEIYNFYHLALIECLKTLTDEQLEIIKLAQAVQESKQDNSDGGPPSN
jgi:hypothetical protein